MSDNFGRAGIRRKIIRGKGRDFVAGTCIFIQYQLHIETHSSRYLYMDRERIGKIQSGGEKYLKTNDPAILDPGQ